MGDQVSDDEIWDLARPGADEAGAWLRQHQPEPGNGRAFWWENLIMRALHVEYHGGSAAQRRDHAGLVVVVTEEAVRQGVARPIDSATRVAHLTGAYLAAGDADRALFDVDAVVARCLDLMPVSREVAVEKARNWPALPIGDIRVLRQARNLLGACEGIAPRVTDPAVAERLAEWLAIRPDLP